ncbi:bcl-2-related ovarian killer protein isoform X4 [Pipistrellus kuhlii]|uniref:bcl-2-related ovarian killer protein isoform X4 n=1 Tax=Pipistrellus kuhlii TaxID=59472 RepID=UPI001E274A68|nr:bcl-2-related ovarian killer protein isoform X4 [Pipistrellus kuhlii]
MEVLRRSSVFAAEIMDAFDRSPTDKELVAQAKALGREFVHARLLRAGLSWSAPERAALAPGGRLAEVCAVLLRLGDELELIRPSIYRNVARQLNISLHSESMVTDAFLAVAAQIFAAVTVDLLPGHRVDGLLQAALVSRPLLSGRWRCVQAAASRGARWCPCTWWPRGWLWTVCGRPSPPWFMLSSIASGSLCARPWQPGCGGAVDGPTSSSVWSAATLASTPIGL